MSISRQNLLYEYLLENTCEGHTANMRDILDYYATVDDAVEVRTVYREYSGRSAAAPRKAQLQRKGTAGPPAENVQYVWWSGVSRSIPLSKSNG